MTDRLSVKKSMRFLDLADQQISERLRARAAEDGEDFPGRLLRDAADYIFELERIRAMGLALRTDKTDGTRATTATKQAVKKEVTE